MEIRSMQPFLHYFGTVRERTMRVARCIPPDKLDWSYAPGKFTLGDLLRHLASPNAISGEKTSRGSQASTRAMARNSLTVWRMSSR